MKLLIVLTLVLVSFILGMAISNSQRLSSIEKHLIDIDRLHVDMTKDLRERMIAMEVKMDLLEVSNGVRIEQEDMKMDEVLKIHGITK